MAKLFEIKGTQATQNAFLAHKAYTRAQALAVEHNGVIDFVDGKKIKATFKTNKATKAFVTAFESEYAEAHKAYEATKTTPTETKTKKTTTKTTKATPSKGKGKTTLNGFIKANPLCTREEAKAHGFEGTRAELKALKTKLGVR